MPYTATTSVGIVQAVGSTTGQFVTDSIPLWYMIGGVLVALFAIGFIWFTAQKGFDYLSRI